jgi:hypothetical protein
MALPSYQNLWWTNILSIVDENLMMWWTIDAKDVMDYAQRHPHDSDDEDAEIQGDRKREAEGGPSSSQKAVKFDETAADPGRVKSEASSSQALPAGSMMDDAKIEEPQTKIPRTSPPTSPTRSLFPEHFAGNVLQAQEQEEVDDEMWEKDVMEVIEGDQELQQDDQDPQDEGHQPTLTPEELEEVDRLAGGDQQAFEHEGFERAQPGGM